MGKSSAFLLHEIIDVLIDDLLHTSRRIDGNLVDIEDSVFDENKSEALLKEKLQVDLSLA